jgi:hypothetical protein
MKHEGSLDANDLTVHKLSFLILLYFEINSTFIDLSDFVIMFISYVHKESRFLNATFFLCCLEGCEILDNSSKLL